MFGALGLGLLFFCVFGVFIIQGGKTDVMVKALPGELTMILGAGIAAMIIGNPPKTLKHVALGIKRIFGSGKWIRSDYMDVMVLVFTLLRNFKAKGPKAIESDIESPGSSQIFQRYPR